MLQIKFKLFFISNDTKQKYMCLNFITQTINNKYTLLIKTKINPIIIYIRKEVSEAPAALYICHWE